MCILICVHPVINLVPLCLFCPCLGYTHPIDDILDELVGCLDHPALPLLQWSEEFSFVESRLPAKLAKQLEAVVHAHEAELNADFDRVAPAEFPGRVLLQLLDEELLVSEGWWDVLHNVW